MESATLVPDWGSGRSPERNLLIYNHLSHTPGIPRATKAHAEVLHIEAVRSSVKRPTTSSGAKAQ